MRSQLLTGEPADSPEVVVDRLLAVQAQDPRGARLAIRIRSTVQSAADVDAAFTERRSLVVSWLNRGTLHLVRSVDYWWLHALTTPQLASTGRRRLTQFGLSESDIERGVESVIETVSAGPTTRESVRVSLERARVPSVGEAAMHLIYAASLRGRLVRGPMIGKEHCFVGPESWIGAKRRDIDRPHALALLARRYLAGHGPAEPADLAKWAGIRLSDARSAFASIADEITASPNGLVDLTDRDAAHGLPPPLLAGQFDPLLHGWASRDEITAGHSGIVTTNGLFRPFALAGGRAVAIWGLAGGRVTIRELEPLSSPTRKALTIEADRVTHYLGVGAPQSPVFVGVPG